MGEGPGLRYSEMAPMVTARWQHTLVEHGKFIYAVGGLGSVMGTLLDTVERYDPVFNTWEQLDVRLRYPR